MLSIDVDRYHYLGHGYSSYACWFCRKLPQMFQHVADKGLAGCDDGSFLGVNRLCGAPHQSSAPVF